LIRSSIKSQKFQEEALLYKRLMIKIFHHQLKTLQKLTITHFLEVNHTHLIMTKLTFWKNRLRWIIFFKKDCLDQKIT